MKCKLEEVCSYIARGITPKYSDSSNFYVMNQKCIRNNTVNFVNSRQHDYTEKKVSTDKILHLYDILVNSTGVGTAGRVAQLKSIPDNYLGITVDSHVTIVRPDPKLIYPEYLGYFLQYKQPSIESLAKGSTGQTEISRNSIVSIEIDLPDLVTQQKIVRILSALDQKIELNNKNNKKLANLAKILFKKQFMSKIYGDKRDGDYLMPKRGKLLLSKNTKQGDVPVVAGGLNPATYHNQSNTLSPVVTISASGANAGYVRLWGENVWASDSSYIDNSITESVYFWYILLKIRQDEIYNKQTGSAQAHIYPRHIGEMEVGDINCGEMLEYNKKVKVFFEKIFNNEQENKKLLLLRDTLLPKLISGEIKLGKTAKK